MILKTFTSIKNPEEAIGKANKEIEKMKLDGFKVKQFAQSESTYYNNFAEEEQFHFTLTMQFEKRKY